MTTLPVWEHWDAMIAVSHGVLGSADEARDCAAEAMAQVLERKPPDIANLEAFMVTVAKRRAIDRIRAAQRARGRDQILAGQVPLSAPDVAEDVVARAEAQWVDAQARTLLKPKVYRLVLMLADGVPMHKASQRLGMTERAAESHLLRARRTIRAALAKTLGVLAAALACGRRTAPAAPAAVIAAATLALHVGLVPGSPNRPVVPPEAPRPVQATAERPAVTTLAGPTRGQSPRAAAPLINADRAEDPMAARPAPAGGQASPVARTPVVGVDTYRSEDANSSGTPVEQVTNCVRNLRVTVGYQGCEAPPNAEG